MQLYDVHADIAQAAGETAIRRDQFIPQEFLDDCRAARDAAFPKLGMPENVSVARVPVAIVESWMRQGFNIFDKNVEAKDIVARLKREGLDAFLTSNMAL